MEYMTQKMFDLSWRRGRVHCLTALCDEDLPDNVSLVCYAIDTLVLAVGDHWGRIVWQTEKVARASSNWSKGLTWRYRSRHKTDVLCFHTYRRKLPPPWSRRMALMSRWSVRWNIWNWSWTAIGVVRDLLPNLGDPSALYEASVWTGDLYVSQSIMTLLRRIHRQLVLPQYNLQVVRTYRMVSHEVTAIPSRRRDRSLQTLSPVVYVVTMVAATGPADHWAANFWAQDSPTTLDEMVE